MNKISCGLYKYGDPEFAFDYTLYIDGMNIWDMAIKYGGEREDGEEIYDWEFLQNEFDFDDHIGMFPVLLSDTFAVPFSIARIEDALKNNRRSYNIPFITSDDDSGGNGAFDCITIAAKISVSDNTVTIEKIGEMLTPYLYYVGFEIEEAIFGTFSADERKEFYDEYGAYPEDSETSRRDWCEKHRETHSDRMEMAFFNSYFDNDEYFGWYDWPEFVFERSEFEQYIEDLKKASEKERYDIFLGLQLDDPKEKDEIKQFFAAEGIDVNDDFAIFYGKYNGADGKIWAGLYVKIFGIDEIIQINKSRKEKTDTVIIFGSNGKDEMYAFDYIKSEYIVLSQNICTEKTARKFFMKLSDIKYENNNKNTD